MNLLRIAKKTASLIMPLSRSCVVAELMRRLKLCSKIEKSKTKHTSTTPSLQHTTQSNQIADIAADRFLSPCPSSIDGLTAIFLHVLTHFSISMAGDTWACKTFPAHTSTADLSISPRWPFAFSLNLTWHEKNYIWTGFSDPLLYFAA